MINLWFTRAEVKSFFDIEKEPTILERLRLEADWMDMYKHILKLEEQLETEKAANDLLSRLDVNVENKRLKEERDSLAKLINTERERFDKEIKSILDFKYKVLEFMSSLEGGESYE